MKKKKNWQKKNGYSVFYIWEKPFSEDPWKNCEDYELDE